MTNWEKICQYLLHAEEAKEVHKMVWPSAGEAYLSGVPFKRNGLPHGQRIKITDQNSLEDVVEIVKWVNTCRIRGNNPGFFLYQ